MRARPPFRTPKLTGALTSERASVRRGRESGSELSERDGADRVRMRPLGLWTSGGVDGTMPTMPAAARGPAIERGASQHGYLTRKDLHDLGWSRRVIQHRVAEGELARSGPQVFRLAAAPVTKLGVAYAATLVTGGAGSHRTAGWLHEMIDHLGVVDVTVGPGSTTRPGRFVLDGTEVRVHATTSLPRDDVLEVKGVRATSAARTALGLASLVPSEVSEPDLVEALSVAVDHKAASEAWLWWMLENRRCRGRNGVLALEVALAELGRLGPTESWLEREFLRLLEEAAVPLPATQRTVAANGRFVARVDFTYEPNNLVIEVLGYAFHRTRAQLEAGTRRANRLQLQGQRVLQFSYDQVVRDPASVLDTVCRALERPAA